MNTHLMTKFCQVDTVAGHLGRRNLNWGNSFIRLVFNKSVGHFHQTVDVGGMTPLWAVTALEMWFWIV